MQNIIYRGARTGKWMVILTVTFLMSLSQSYAAENPYKDTSVERVTSDVIMKFNRFDFLESIVSTPDGTIYTTDLLNGIIYKIKNGSPSKLTDTNGKLVGITLLDRENLIVTGSDNQNKGIVIRVNTNTGTTTTLATIPGAILLNGIAKLGDNLFLIADSFKGVLWKLDSRDGSASIWLDHDLLASPSVESNTPGVNGIKIRNNAVYISNTGKMILAKIPLTENKEAGEPEVIHNNVFIDDFAIDEAGNIFGATHVYDSVIKITPLGKVSIIAQTDQGVSGSTCVTIKSGTQNTLLVSTNGGLLKTDQCDVVPAKIVQLELK